MQRRLMFALVGIALAAVLLVGAGVLVLAQIGAREDTESEVRDRLDAVADLVDRPTSLESFRSLEGTRNAFGLADLDFVIVEDDGEVRRLLPILAAARGQGRRPTPPVDEEVLAEDDVGRWPAALVGDEVLLTLTEDDMARYGNGETVVVGRQGNNHQDVIAIRRMDTENTLLADLPSVAIIARQGVVTVGSQARAWFLVSAIVVLAGSGFAAWILARRLSKPIKEIEQATASIAAGDFTVRVGAKSSDELGDLGRSVNRMARDLERSKALDQQFLMSVSHDLRTPLTAIAGYAEALSDGAVDDARRTGEIIGNHAERLERLVGDLLDLAKLDANRFALDLRTLDVGVNVGRTVAGLLPRAEQHLLALSFHHQGPVEAEADPDRLAQVVSNVIENAITFARHQIVTTVSTDGSSVVIEVVDDGPGIAEEDLPHVFERLYVSKSQPVRAENSTGIGLAIVRELMTAMGGSVWAERGPSGGTKIVLLLPLAISVPGPVSAEPS